MPRQVPGLDQALAPLGESLGFDIGMLKVRVKNCYRNGGIHWDGVDLWVLGSIADGRVYKCACTCVGVSVCGDW